MNLTREWTAFAGSLFTLMGISIGATARRGAEDALAWERQWRVAVGDASPARDEEPRRRRLVLAYRAGGAFFAAIGLGFLYAAAAGRAPFVARHGARDTAVGGLILLACGLATAFKTARAGRRAPRFLDGEMLADDVPAPLGERVAAACSYGMIALFLSFGVRLLREGLR